VSPGWSRASHAAAAPHRCSGSWPRPGGAALGGGWLELLAFGALAGGVLALALRAFPAARELIRSLRPSAPRLTPLHEIVRLGLTPAAIPALHRFTRLARDRAPPAAA
jgi:hypothetical protein